MLIFFLFLFLTFSFGSTHYWIIDILLTFIFPLKTLYQMCSLCLWLELGQSECVGGSGSVLPAVVPSIFLSLSRFSWFISFVLHVLRVLVSVSTFIFLGAWNTSYHSPNFSQLSLSMYPSFANKEKYFDFQKTKQCKSQGNYHL